MSTEVERLFVLNSPEYHAALASAQGEVFARYGVPEQLRGHLHALLQIPFEILADLATVLTNTSAEELHRALESSVTEIDKHTIYRCPKCEETSPLPEGWRESLSPLLCAKCTANAEKKHRAKLHRRNIRSALARARAAGRQATLTEVQWHRTVEHWSGQCAYCGNSPWFVVSFAVPIELGGDASRGNCVPACFRCDATKGRRNLPELCREEAFSGERLSEIARWLGLGAGE